MNFDKQDGKGQKYALLYPLYKENEEMKAAAEEAGARNALMFDRKEKAYRLYEAKVPGDVDVDKVFGKYASDEAKAASASERDKVEEMKKEASKATGTQIDESKVYYPAVGNGDRDEFNKLRNEKGAKFVYSSRVGGFVHRDGPTEGFEKFQTPEAKAAWESEYQKTKEMSDRRRENATQAVDVMAERANGREFLADNSNGFMLPSTKEAEVRAKQLEAMKKASDEEVAQVFRITESAKKALETKLYAIQINAAKERGVSVEEFNAKDEAGRREAANFVGLSKQDFSKKAALTGGFFELRNEMISRGLMESRQSAKDIQNGNSQSGKEGAGTKEMKPEQESKAESKGTGNAMAQALAAGAMKQGAGR